MLFKDREQAGRQLAEKLQKYKGKDTLILAIPRGGLVIGFALAKALGAPLDIIVTKKIGYPGDPEYAIGAVGPNKAVIVNEDAAKDVPKDYIDEQVKEISAAINEKYRKYKGKVEIPNLKDKIVILTDDGVATGSTIKVSIELIKQQHPKKIVVAIPVGPPETIHEIAQQVDEIICLEQPTTFFAIGAFYDNFPQVEDEEAITYLKEANK